MKRFLILGGSSGIGKSIAKICRKNNKVIITGRSEDKLIKTKNQLETFGDISQFSADFGDLNGLDVKINKFVKTNQSLDGLVINGPLPPLKTFQFD